MTADVLSRELRKDGVVKGFACLRLFNEFADRIAIRSPRRPECGSCLSFLPEQRCTRIAAIDHGWDVVASRTEPSCRTGARRRTVTASAWNSTILPRFTTTVWSDARELRAATPGYPGRGGRRPRHDPLRVFRAEHTRPQSAPLPHDGVTRSHPKPTLERGENEMGPTKGVGGQL